MTKLGVILVGAGIGGLVIGLNVDNSLYAVIGGGVWGSFFSVLVQSLWPE